MGIARGSWWQSRDTDERMAVGHCPKTRGAHPDRYSCFVEGRGKNILWLTPSEIRGGWRHWRPKPDLTPVPAWILNRPHNDMIYGKSPAFRVVVAEIKRGWLRLTGLMEEPRLRVKTFRETEDGHEDGIVQPFDW